MLNFMITRLQGIGQLKSCFSILKWRQAATLSMLNILKKSKKIKINVGDVGLFIRSSSPDFSVVKESLVYGEFDDIKVYNPKTIIDLGANIGTSAIALARQFPDATIFAVEMEESNFDILRENIAPFKKIVPVHAAVASASGTREIFDRKTGPWGYTIADTQNDTSELGQKIEALTLDSLCERFHIDKIDILKVDIEGAEKEIFEASGRWLDITSSIVVELHDYITMGASRAFYIATVDFSHFERHGEKIIAYR